MNYRMTQEFKPPFCINALIEEAGALKVNTSLLFHKSAGCIQGDNIILFISFFC